MESEMIDNSRDNSKDELQTFRCWTYDDDPVYRYHKIVETRSMDRKVIKANEFCVNEKDLKRLQESKSSQEQEKILVELMKQSECNKTEERKYWIGFDQSYGHDEYCETVEYIGFGRYIELMKSVWGGGYYLDESLDDFKIAHDCPNSTLEPKESITRPYNIFAVADFESGIFAVGYDY